MVYRIFRRKRFQELDGFHRPRWVTGHIRHLVDTRAPKLWNPLLRFSWRHAEEGKQFLLPRPAAPHHTTPHSKSLSSPYHYQYHTIIMPRSRKSSAKMRSKASLPLISSIPSPTQHKIHHNILQSTRQKGSLAAHIKVSHRPQGNILNHCCLI